jgi:pimeloyl-ACP methyl ester carboxylesterase
MSPASSLATARVDAGARAMRLTDGTTAYHVHGDHGPWVVLVHGLLTPMYAWEGTAIALANAGFRVLRYDHFGRGLSDRPRARYDLDLYVRQLRELTLGLGITSSHVVGWSMGTLIATRFAIDYPNAARSMVLIAPAFFLEPPPRLRAVTRLPFARAIIALRARALIDELPGQHLIDPERLPGYRERMHEQRRYPGLGASLASTILNFAWHAGPELRAAGEHARPVLLVWGDRDQATPYANAARTRALFPRAELFTIPGALHAPHVDQPDETHAAILRFYAQHATGA